MKFIIGKPLSNDINPQSDKWIPIKETRLMKLHLLALPIAFVLAFIIDSIYYFLNIKIFDSYISFIYAALIIIPLHELSHALLFPKSIFSKDVLFGFYPKAFVFYTHYEGEITRNRFILILLSPIINITILPIIFIIMTGTQNILLAKVAFINALSSSIDLLTVIQTVKVVPKKASIRYKGFKSYWREFI